MKKLLLLATTFTLVFALTACQDSCVGTACVSSEGTSVQAENILNYDHINGYGLETPKLSYVLFEHKMRDYVKYEVSYLSCTCRESEYNFWQTAYIEINLSTNDVRFISYDKDSSGHYNAGNWGDSSPTPAGKTEEDFKVEFLPWIVGQTSESLDGIFVFTNDDYHGIQNTTTIDDTDLIDAYAGSSVSTNNMIRVVKELLEYHKAKYN